jgi:hypothetical protein
VEEDEERNLDILVENMGRNNVGHHLNDQRKGKSMVTKVAQRV